MLGLGPVSPSEGRPALTLFGKATLVDLLTSNAKLSKPVSGWTVLGLQLLPGPAAGFGDLCPGRGSCYAQCLAWAGRGAMRSVREARARRTALLFEHPENFASQLDAELLRHTVGAISRAERPAIRLNVLSDIDWREHPAVYRVLRRHAAGGVVFYDYTKRLDRPDPTLYGSPARVCYSWSERSTTVPGWADWVAVVGDGTLPLHVAAWRPANARPFGWRISDGDGDDLFFLRPPGPQILKPKGLARAAGSGGLVVRRPTDGGGA